MYKEKNNPIEEVVDNALKNLNIIADSSTIIGKPIANEAGVVILPVSKVSMGFVAGGGEYPAKKRKKKDPFVGGSGAGISLIPMGFLTIIGGIPNFIRIENRTTFDKLGDMLPDLIEKLTAGIKTDKENCKK